MDPQACLAAALEQDADNEECLALLRELLAWIDRGGLRPVATDYQLNDLEALISELPRADRAGRRDVRRLIALLDVPTPAA